MATIGLDKPYYAKITEDPSTGYETYGTPKVLAKAISADLSATLAEATLYADDGAAENVKEFVSGTLTLGINDLGNEVAADLLGVTVDSNGVVISTSEDTENYVAIGFRAKRSNGKYQYYWLYKVKFGIPGSTLATKGDNITFNTPSLEGTVLRRNKPDANGGHPWKAEVVEGATGVVQTAITNWYSSVYEPTYSDASVTLSALSVSNTLTPTFSSSVTDYTSSTTSTSDTIAIVPSDDSADVIITLNGDSVTNGDTVEWDDGENIVKVNLTKGSCSKTYTVVVTKS